MLAAVGGESVSETNSSLALDVDNKMPNAPVVAVAISEEPAKPALPAPSREEATARATVTGQPVGKSLAAWLNELQTTPSEQFVLQLKAKINDIIESGPFVLIMSILTIWALFSDDLRVASAKKDADVAFTAIISIAFFMFFLEIVLASYCKGQEYFYIPEQVNLPGESNWQAFQRRAAFGSFYFWLDCIATVSLIFEINWIIRDALETGQQAAKGGNASRAGARAGRIVRLVRMVRLIRLAKLYKYASKLKSKDETECVVVDADGEVEDLPQQSRIGSALTDLTNRRVIILVLAILIIIPNLQATEDDLLYYMITQAIDRMGRGFFTIDKSTYAVRPLSLCPLLPCQ